jgi:hypothetical protein
VIVDTACLDNSYLIDYVKPKESKTQGKFVPTCHYCGKICHIRPNCYLLKSHRPWNKQVAPKHFLINMSRPIGDIYLKKVRTLFCVRMLTLKLQSLSRSILANEVNLPIITMVSQDTLGHTIIRSGIRSLGSRNKSQRQVSLTLNLSCLIMLFGERPNASEWSLNSPRRIKSMKGLSTWWRVS